MHGSCLHPLASPPITASCIVDYKRRTFPPEMYSVLASFAEIAVRELERDKVRCGCGMGGGGCCAGVGFMFWGIADVGICTELFPRQRGWTGWSRAAHSLSLIHI